AGETRRRENVAWIATIAVHPDFRRQGIASALLDICESELKTPSVRLTVRKTNTEAIQLYEQRGYHLVGIMREYYGDNEDGIIYEKQLFS
ncbi:MAG: GNAT family N-acetyltransferase, partial [candidate division Zixibacteria bacterium]|nr:GNAT family N-acetyltransferase [candidate division Zixibacteria bacterium]NIW44277.1 GNAT family N-acetyltransferase [Gammaproteobacteria bacterium]NIR63360.1 GNAT family N-acetyltransferase [candidate division Zixibacteria bacterium]NIS45357.1 GNAT family N-acetyltransferase [candidate division Zixibacteria bacterium]NIT53736.1 GNAT family N-acetyltransferase [candidate division Zixibacteria bacterium]